MRVITGEAKGRRLSAPAGIRPTAGQVKEALFSAIAPRIGGARVLDLYAGSGALGIEALSRGAAHAVFVDESAASVASIGKNLEATGLGSRASVKRSAAEAFVAGAGRGAFDIVFADPPYGDDPAALLEVVARRGVLAPGGLLVLETAPARAGGLEAPSGMRAGDVRRYGDSALVIFEPEEGAP